MCFGDHSQVYRYMSGLRSWHALWCALDSGVGVKLVETEPAESWWRLLEPFLKKKKSVKKKKRGEEKGAVLLFKNIKHPPGSLFLILFLIPGNLGMLGFFFIVSLYLEEVFFPILRHSCGPYRVILAISGRRLQLARLHADHKIHSLGRNCGTIHLLNYSQFASSR